MDRLDAMRAFVLTVDEGGLSAAARRLRRSPAAVTRAVAVLEEEVGTRLLLRTTRSVHLTEAGERYLESCRRILADWDSALALAAGERAAARGKLFVTAPVVFGRLHVRPVIDAFLDAEPEVRAQLQLVDRVVDLVDEGVDAAIRIGHLPDSTLVATRLGAVGRVVCAAPSLLARLPPIREPADLSAAPCISFGPAAAGWSFAGPTRQGVRVPVTPRLDVNGAEAALDSAIAGHGVTRVLSYQAAAAFADGRLVRLLPEHEPEPLPVHLVYAGARLAAAKLRAFVDFAVPRLRDPAIYRF
ncbi:LysR family transcriptional regulator [Oharaeibacter diazotrophicus]|uniref:LysR family transcriptional regulator n=1 Tax=Oharaeibacter diazotrophicus TaxID=1920512 RepID=A0A4R6RLA0_9HYPH|nr:LysR family transcriptional regulator [Oharaeibacter diazotrophicus]TDP87262.1 LysR family transcriptional regulator [Oharaeibacter diazotrophicus]GLS77543.1 transcriptional regulator [Oharaeibacter diazotrophicus]